MNTPAIQTEDLYKEYPGKRSGLLARVVNRNGRSKQPLVAVDGLSLTIHRGEVFGLLGPNGAGKTTTIKMISTLLRPTRGRVLVFGQDVEESPLPVLSAMGTVLSGERCVYWKLTGRENLAYFGALYGLRGDTLRRRIESLLERFQLSQRADELVEKYSTGMKRRIALARALLHRPRLLILDEPTAGLDPQSARNLRELILELRDEGTTILLTTHYMEEADSLSDRVAVMDRGSIIALGTPEQLKASLEETRVVHLTTETWSEEEVRDLYSRGLISHHHALYDESERSWKVSLHLASHSTLGQVVSAYLEQGNGISGLRLHEPSLEDVFIQLTGKSLRD